MWVSAKNIISHKKKLTIGQPCFRQSKVFAKHCCESTGCTYGGTDKRNDGRTNRGTDRRMDDVHGIKRLLVELSMHYDCIELISRPRAGEVLLREVR